MTISDKDTAYELGYRSVYGEKPAIWAVPVAYIEYWYAGVSAARAAQAPAPLPDEATLPLRAPVRMDD